MKLSDDEVGLEWTTNRLNAKKKQQTNGNRPSCSIKIEMAAVFYFVKQSFWFFFHLLELFHRFSKSLKGESKISWFLFWFFITIYVQCAHIHVIRWEIFSRLSVGESGTICKAFFVMICLLMMCSTYFIKRSAMKFNSVVIQTFIGKFFLSFWLSGFNNGTHAIHTGICKYKICIFFSPFSQKC